MKIDEKAVAAAQDRWAKNWNEYRDISIRMVIEYYEAAKTEQPDVLPPHSLDADMWFQSYLDSHDFPHDFDAVAEVLHQYKNALSASKREIVEPMKRCDNPDCLCHCIIPDREDFKRNAIEDDATDPAELKEMTDAQEAEAAAAIEEQGRRG